MAGHSHWAGIKHKKEITDQKRGRIFAKLLSAITAAARREPNPDFNPRLRTAVFKARELSVPNEKIAQAIKRSSEFGEKLEELTFEAYGPGGVAILIEVISDNKNKTVSEIKKIIGDYGGKWAESGSVVWAFDEAPQDNGGGWKAKFVINASDADRKGLELLVESLGDHSDVQKIFTNADFIEPK